MQVCIQFQSRWVLQGVIHHMELVLVVRRVERGMTCRQLGRCVLLALRSRTDRGRWSCHSGELIRLIAQIRRWPASTSERGDQYSRTGRVGGVGRMRVARDASPYRDLSPVGWKLAS
jgi:hypothetical protein